MIHLPFNDESFWLDLNPHYLSQRARDRGNGSAEFKPEKIIHKAGRTGVRPPVCLGPQAQPERLGEYGFSDFDVFIDMPIAKREDFETAPTRRLKRWL